MLLEASVHNRLDDESWAERYQFSFRPRFLNWHPIVLEEIALKDFSSEEVSTTRAPFGVECQSELDAGLAQQIRYVPLPTFETGSYRRDPAHTEMKRPKMNTVIPATVHTELYLG